ncbi:PREDICTED: uncharacterized protein LOC109188564 [Ipomoea nil]|uniref:uncharacterized protein LOC109188564 n=1 Tax=Ipomoea nil TaxID=35883 RepID=UPI00090138D6|nr:PREDICTED: uncharacterized protein LOC109188564 [Ipomoea nil]
MAGVDDAVHVAEVIERAAEISIDSEEECFAPVEEGVADGSEAPMQTWTVVGRFLTAKMIKLEYMRQVLASVWQPVMGVMVTEIHKGLFLFVFFHKTDVDYVLDGGPWAFENNTLVCRLVGDGVLPVDVALNTVDMWVQLHDIPMGYTSQPILEQMGNFIGTFVKHDERFAGAPWLAFYRIRVSIPVDKPLRRGMKMLKRDKTTCWVNFRYERLHSFCFFCGLMGHTYKFCVKARVSTAPVHLYPYGADMRVGGNRGPREVGDSWLVPVGSRPRVVEGVRVEGEQRGGEVREDGARVVAAGVRGADSAVVAISKRRREGGHEGEVRGSGEDVTMADVSKNSYMAGAAVQFRPSS